MPSRRPMRTRPSALALLSCAVALVGSVAPASAGLTDHSGDYGGHWVLGDVEYPSAICHYDGSDRLDRITVRAPVAFAHDRTGGPDSQPIAWRVELDGGFSTAGEAPAFLGPKQRVTAADPRPAHFTDQVIDLPWSFWDDESVWTIAIRFLWYRPSKTIDGFARHQATLTEWAVSGPDVRSSHCPSVADPATATSPSGSTILQHSGDIGRHHLLESGEYPSVTCERDDDGYLTKIRVRRPILFADDRGAGVQSQTVRWRVQIVPVDLTSGADGDPPVVVTEWRSATASETRFADLSAAVVSRSRDFWDDRDLYRVIYQFQWLYQGTTVDGRAKHIAALYQSHSAVTSACATLDE